MTNADSSVRTAVSRVVVSMMEHEWPDSWPELFDQFSSIVADPKYVPQCQMVFMVLKRLIENVYSLVTVENAGRRNTLKNSITALASDIIRITVQRLRVCIAEGNNEQSVLLAKSGIELLSEVFDWVSGKVLAEYIDRKSVV